MQHQSPNRLFEIASELINYSNRNIFLTGKAGTGKTTFLKHIRQNCPKQMAVAASTGVAAMNAGGVTLHSLFQLPVSPFIPEARGFSKNEETINPHSLLSRLRMNNEKKKVLQELELLIIDEISMVRCDILDAVDTVLKHIRNNHRHPFGGVQVLFIGDMFQLPPVIKEQEWQFLSPYYDGPYFFNSHVFKNHPALCIEFEKIYRQSDEKFIRLLNQVRNNDMDEISAALLETRFQPTFQRKDNDGYIILTTHNDTAREENMDKLKKINKPLFNFEAEIEDDFPENAFPAEAQLHLKEGAQVMFIKNDMDKARRYYNGKIGTITELSDEKIVVRCEGESTDIEVKKEKWENIRYEVNKTTRLLEEKLLGSFSQYPLRLAWAITIHKSQGLTFEKAIIDAGKSFASGQVYVALSRCTNLEGMVLKSRIQSDSLRTDQRITRFAKLAAPVQQLEQDIIIARKEYWQQILLSLFDFTNSNTLLAELHGFLQEHSSSFNEPSAAWLSGVREKTAALQTVAERFQQQLAQLIAQGNDALLQERVKAGASHFNKEIETLVVTLQQSPITTDSRLHAKEFNDSLKEIIQQLAFKSFLFKEGESLDLVTYLTKKRTFVAPGNYPNAYAAASNKVQEDVPHPVLLQQLRKKRNEICDKKQLALYLVAGSQSLAEMCTYLPQTEDELEKISGFGKAKIKSYGAAFLEIIVAYCEEHSLSSSIHEKTDTKKKRERLATNTHIKTDTKELSYQLYKEGNSIAVIAEQRKLAISTIESHLTHYISIGTIPVEELVADGKLKRIQHALQNHKEEALAPLKTILGDDISFGEIRMVVAANKYKIAQTQS